MCDDFLDEINGCCVIGSAMVQYLDEEERAGCFDFTVFRMSCYCNWPVALPYGAVGGSTVCDCGIS